MSYRDDPDFERELTAGLERLAPEPRRGLLERTMIAVSGTSQRGAAGIGVGEMFAALRRGSSRAAVVVAVGALALLIGIVIGTSGLIPTGQSPAPSPSAPQSPLASDQEPGGWAPVTIQPLGGPGDVIAQHAYAWDGGVVVTGQLAGPLAEALGGVQPLAWYSRDGVSWLPASVANAAYDIGPVFEAGGSLMAFGLGAVQGSEQPTAVLFTSTDGGATWANAEQPLSPGVVIADVVAGGPGFVAVGYTPETQSNAVIWTSADGLEWHAVAMGVRQVFGGLYAIASNGSTLVAAGATYAEADGQPDAGVWTSTDGLTWTHQSQPADASSGLSDVVATSDGFVAVGVSGVSPAAWWSPDGVTWTRTELDASLGARQAWAVAAVADGLVAIGDGTDHAVAWRSSDGRTWGPAERLATDAGATSVVRVGASTLVVGTTAARTGVKQPVAWMTPASAVPAPTPAPTLVPVGPPAAITGETPAPDETPRPGITALPGVTLSELSALAGELGLSCESGQRSIPDAPDLSWGVVCAGQMADGTQVTLDALYLPPADVGNISLTILSAGGSAWEGVPQAEAIIAAAVRLSYTDSQPDQAEAWVRASMHRAECWVSWCETVIGPVRLVLSPGARGDSLFIDPAVISN